MRLSPLLLYISSNLPHPFIPSLWEGQGGSLLSPPCQGGLPFGRVRVGFYFMSRYGILSISP